MTLRRTMFVLPDATPLGTTPLEARLALSGLLADDGSSALGFHQGVLYDGSGTNVVVGTTDTGTMTYQLRACQIAFYALGVASAGACLLANDAALKVNTTAAPGSNSRIDVVWVRQPLVASDGGADSVTAPILGCTQGTASASPAVPAIPTGAYALAQFLVPTGTTQTSALTATMVHGWAATAGSPIPVRNNTERNALTAFDGLQVYRLDNHVRETYNGTLWVADDISTCSFVSITPTAANTPTSATVTFPAGLFQATPVVQTTAASAVPGSTVTGTGTTAASTSGATIWVTRTNTTGTFVNYQAQQPQQA